MPTPTPSEVQQLAAEVRSQLAVIRSCVARLRSGDPSALKDLEHATAALEVLLEPFKENYQEQRE